MVESLEVLLVDGEATVIESVLVNVLGVVDVDVLQLVSFYGL